VGREHAAVGGIVPRYDLRMRRWFGRILVCTVAALAAGACAGPPQARLADDRRANGVPAGGPVLMEAVIVDLNADARTLAVKDVLNHETWTVVTDSLKTTIRGLDGGEIGLADIQIGQKVRIHGNSRVESVIDADQIDIEDVRATDPRSDSRGGGGPYR